MTEGAESRRTLQVRQSFIGPLPPPEVLASYEAIQPGFAERIVRLAESEAEHRRAQERRALMAEIWEVRLGQIFGLLIGALTIVAGAWTAAQGHPITGGVIGTAGVAGLVSVFIVGRRPPPSQPAT